MDSFLMPQSAPLFRVVSVDCFERSVHYRLPFRFGAATVTEGVQAFVRVRIRLDDGREAHGAAAELMVPKWFDKNPALANEDNIDQLRRSLAVATDVYVSSEKSDTAFGHFASHMDECASALRDELPSLAAAFGPAEVDKAVLDALCRALGISFYDAVRHDAIGFRPGKVAPDTAGMNAPEFLRSLEPQSTLDIRHTVGMVDALRGDPGMVNDELPESLEQAIRQYGLRWFKLKLGGDVVTDLARLRDIAAVLDTLPEYSVTLDGNEQYALEALREFLGALRTDVSLQRLSAAVSFVEQPLPRRQTFETSVTGHSHGFSLLIDEADGTLNAFTQGRDCGYTGVSSKSCKGLYKSLINAMRCHAWNGASERKYFISGEDLTTPAGLAVQQDLALVSLLGIGHVERNGHHYINGMASAPIDEQRSFLAHHPDLYEDTRGAVRLKISGGKVSIGSLHVPAYASGAVPTWGALTPMSFPPKRLPCSTGQ